MTEKVKVIIKCFKHGEFQQSPGNHLQNNGCPKCRSVISKPEIKFLDLLDIKIRHLTLKKYPSKIVDGYDDKTNTIYEFLGDYWHGNPVKFDHNNINKHTKKTFGELYTNTFKIFDKLKSLGYNIKYIWETDWKKYIKGISSCINIIDY